MIRLFNHYLSRTTLLQAMLDACVLFAALVLGYWLRFDSFGASVPALEAMTFAGLTMVSMSAVACTTIKRRRSAM